MSDLISRQAAIDSICRTVCDNPEICESPCDEIKVLEIMPSAQPDVPDTNVGDIISRQAAITLPVMPKEHREYQTHNLDDAYEQGWNDLQKCIESLPSAQPEQLTDKEQRIFLSAMGREEKVCKQVDDECRNCREPYEDSLVKTCHEITRKVKGALWET